MVRGYSWQIKRMSDDDFMLWLVFKYISQEFDIPASAWNRLAKVLGRKYA